MEINIYNFKTLCSETKNDGLNILCAIYFAEGKKWYVDFIYIHFDGTEADVQSQLQSLLSSPYS